MFRVTAADGPVMKQPPFIAGWTVRLAPVSTKVKVGRLMFTMPKAHEYTGTGLVE